MRRKDCKSESLIGEEKRDLFEVQGYNLAGKERHYNLYSAESLFEKKILRNLQEKNNQLSFAPRIPTKTGIKSKSLKEIRGL